MSDLAPKRTTTDKTTARTAVQAEPRSRIRWADLPESVRSAVEFMMDGPVVAAHSQAGGYSPGSADRVVTAQGSRKYGGR